MNFISTAKNEGATILYGGARPRVRTFSFVNCPYMDYAVISFVFLIEFYGGKWQHLRKGFFIEPTIITDVSTSMQIWREEVFGPVLCVKTFSTEHEAIALANDTEWVTSYLHRFVPIFWILLHSQQFGNVKKKNSLVMSLLLIFHSYGLGAAVISKDLERCERLTKVRTLEFLNAACPYIDGA